MKIATWNVNGIRAREAQLQDFIDREQPDVLCLQEIKASLDQLPVWLCDIEGYWCYWHGGKGYSGVGLQVRKDHCVESPGFHHPPFDYEQRIVTVTLPQATVASIYVPNGGKDFAAKMRFLEAMDAYAAEFAAAGEPLVLCGDLNVARTDMDVHPKERKPRAHRAAAGRTRAARAHHRSRPRGRPAHAAPRQRGAVHVVGAVAQHEPAQYRLAPRLRARVERARRPRRVVRRAARVRHQRPRAGHRRLRASSGRLERAVGSTETSDVGRPDPPSRLSTADQASARSSPTAR